MLSLTHRLNTIVRRETVYSSGMNNNLAWASSRDRWFYVSLILLCFSRVQVDWEKKFRPSKYFFLCLKIKSLEGWRSIIKKLERWGTLKWPIYLQGRNVHKKTLLFLAFGDTWLVLSCCKRIKFHSFLGSSSKLTDGLTHK